MHKFNNMSRYLYIIFFGLVVFILGLFLYNREELQKYKNLYYKELQNVNAYRVSNSGLEEEIRQYQMYMSDLRTSKDSVDRKIARVIDELKIKDSKIEYLQYQSSVTSKTDTIKFTDTLFVKSIDVDTVLKDNWYELKVGLHYPSELIVSPTFNSEKYIVINSKKEYINPPSKIFFVRWFQKKYTVVEVNIEEKSPYIVNKENKFIKVLK